MLCFFSTLAYIPGGHILIPCSRRFDYGEFRHVAGLVTSTATYDTFGFVFEDAGTYVFSSSCNSLSIFVLVVMPEDVR